MLLARRAMASQSHVLARGMQQGIVPVARRNMRPACEGEARPSSSSLTAFKAVTNIGTRCLSTSSIRRQQDEAEAPREMDSGEKDIHDILTREFQPRQLQVQDVSGGCGSFYSIAIISSKFKGMPTVKAHRMVNDSLKDIIKGIHGLQLRTIPADD